MALQAKLLTLVIIVGAFINLPRDLKLGPITVVGLLTIFYAAASWLLVLAHFTVPRAALMMKWLALFLAWGFSSFIWNPPTPAGMQNLIAYAAFAGLLLLSATESYQAPDLANYVGTSLRWAMRLAVLLFALGVTSESPRSLALFILIGLGWFLAEWRSGVRSGFWWAVLMTLVIGISHSRLALFVALMLFPISSIQLKSLRRWLRVSFWVALVALTSYVLIAHVDSINARFVGGDQALQIGELAINTAGRVNNWTHLLRSFWESPMIGKGSGSANALLSEIDANMKQPHNDYLRIMHDYGAIGLGLWLLGFGGLLWATWRAWQYANKESRADVRLHLAAFLALVAVAVAMLTDNVSVYIYVMGPLAVLVGTSLGSMSRNRNWTMQRILSARSSAVDYQTARAHNGSIAAAAVVVEAGGASFSK